jgi:hypothetical protein
MCRYLDCEKIALGMQSLWLAASAPGDDNWHGQRQRQRTVPHTGERCWLKFEKD